MPPPSPECPRQELDIVFLIDGSGSISSDNFATMMNFVRAVINQFQRPSTQVCLWGREAAGGRCLDPGEMASAPALCASSSFP